MFFVFFFFFFSFFFFFQFSKDNRIETRLTNVLQIEEEDHGMTENEEQLENDIAVDHSSEFLEATDEIHLGIPMAAERAEHIQLLIQSGSNNEHKTHQAQREIMADADNHAICIDSVDGADNYCFLSDMTETHQKIIQPRNLVISDDSIDPEENHHQVEVVIEKHLS